VIYQPEAEFEGLPENLRWRHVRYEPGQVDFTWEREWRVRCDELPLEPNEIGVIVPSREWAERLQERHDEEQDSEVETYSLMFDRVLAELYREDFPWRIYLLG
jgi:hypothetical protein